MDDIAILAKAASIVRNDMFGFEDQFNFSGSFTSKCQENSVPTSLKSLIAMILNGTNIKDQEKHESQPCLTLSQTILFNSKKRVNNAKPTIKKRHVREPPLPLYIGLNIHTTTRSKTLINKLYQMGLCISYDRVLEVEEWLATSASERYDGHVVPACLKNGIGCIGQH